MVFVHTRNKLLYQLLLLQTSHCYHQTYIHDHPFKVVFKTQWSVSINHQEFIFSCLKKIKSLQKKSVLQCFEQPIKHNKTTRWSPRFSRSIPWHPLRPGLSFFDVAGSTGSAVGLVGRRPAAIPGGVYGKGFYHGNSRMVRKEGTWQGIFFGEELDFTILPPKKRRVVFFKMFNTSLYFMATSGPCFS